MKSIRKLLYTCTPKYAWISLLLTAAYQSILYFGSSQLISTMTPHLMSTALDDALPLVPAFIYIYLLAFLQWALGSSSSPGKAGSAASVFSPAT